MIKKLLISFFLTLFIFLFFADSKSFALQCQQCPDRTSRGYSDPLLVDNPGCFKVNSNEYLTYEQYPKVCMYNFGNSPNNACDIPVNQTCSAGQECYKQNGIETGRGCVGAGTLACTKEKATCFNDSECRPSDQPSCGDFRCVTKSPPGYLYTQRECGALTQGGECAPPSVYNGAQPFQPFPTGMCVAAPPPSSSSELCLYCPSNEYESVFTNPPSCKDGTPPLRAECNSETQRCSPIIGCVELINPNTSEGRDIPCPTSPDENGNCPYIATGFGVNIPTTIAGFTSSLLGIILSLAGGIALILIIISGYRIMASQGNPETLQQAKEQLTAAIVGLLFVIFSLLFLEVIGVNILKLPGFI